MATPRSVLAKTKAFENKVRALCALCRTLARERDARESECRTLRSECAALKEQNEQLRLLLKRDAEASHTLLTKLKP